MAKKSTVGGPKSHRTTAEDLERRKQYLSRAEKEQRNVRWIWFGTGALIAISIIVLIAAVTNEQFIRPRQWISKVNSVEISTEEFQDRVRLTRWQTAEQVRYIYTILGGDPNQVQQYAGQEITNLRYSSLMGEEVLTEMEEDILIEQWAKAYGIEVDNAELDAKVDEFMARRVGLAVPGADTPTPTLEPTLTLTPLVSPTPSNTPAPTATLTPAPTEEGDAEGSAEDDAEEPTPGPTATVTSTPEPTATLADDEIMATVDKQQDTYFDDVTDGADIDRDVVRKAFYYQALREAMLEKIGEDVELEELQVNARHILISFAPGAQPGTTPPPTDEEKAAALARAEEVMDALQNGEPFADLAKAVSDDTGSGAQGGELGWASPEGYVEAFKDAVLSADIGAIVGPIETEFGYHIIQVHEREIRDLTDSELQNRRQQAFLEWIEEEKTLWDNERRGDWRDRVPDDPTYNSLLGDILPIS